MSRAARLRRPAPALGTLERWGLHLALLGVALSGLSYGALKYFGQRVGPFGAEARPIQAWAQHGHVLLGPALVFCLGVVVKAHAAPRLSAKRARRSGFALVLVMAPLVVSGYAGQMAVEPGWHTALAWVHGTLALLFLAGYGLHLLRPPGTGDRS